MDQRVILPTDPVHEALRDTEVRGAVGQTEAHADFVPKTTAEDLKIARQRLKEVIS